MDLNYLVNVVLPARKLEFIEGNHNSVRHPIHVVMDLTMHVTQEHSNYLKNYTNLKEKPIEFGYIDDGLDSENQEFKKDPYGMIDPLEITRFWTDTPVAFFLTNYAAHRYLEYQKHNLSPEAYVYTFDTGYRNDQMDQLFKNE